MGLNFAANPDTQEQHQRYSFHKLLLLSLVPIVGQVER